jgi:hypothetical protein
MFRPQQFGHRQGEFFLMMTEFLRPKHVGDYKLVVQ